VSVHRAEADLAADGAALGEGDALPRGCRVDREDAQEASFRSAAVRNPGSLYFPVVATKKVGVLTGGGDCPGLNAVIRAVVRRAQGRGVEVLGIRNGWLGLIEGDVEPLTSYSVIGILPKGGTILGTSRVDPLRSVEDRQRLEGNVKRYGLDGLIVAGGEGTLSAARDLHKDGLPVVGVPKTIDNDLRGTDYTFGFDTAVNIVREAIDRLHTTAESHHRVMVVEVMGRHVGWIAAFGGMAGGADLILIPEKPYRIEEMCSVLESRRRRGRSFSIVVVAEGAAPAGEPLPEHVGEGISSGVGYRVAEQIGSRMGVETRVTVLGHIQRGGSPTAFDRILATRFGLRAVDLVCEEKFGLMVGLHGTRMGTVTLAEATAGPKTMDLEHFAEAEVFFG
jgi:6-phosphofructokinase 1